jgi:hypothetical protein
MPLTPAVVALATAIPHLAAARVDTPPKLDGRLDDPVWKMAPASDAFTQKQPVDGKPRATGRSCGSSTMTSTSM